MAKYTREQLDAMTDEEFMALDPSDMEVTDDVMGGDYATTQDQLGESDPSEQEEASTDETIQETDDESDDGTPDGDTDGTDGSADSGDTDDTSEEAEDTASEEEEPEGQTDQPLTGGEEVSEKDLEKDKDKETAETKEEAPEPKTPAKGKSPKVIVPEGVTQEQVTAAIGFYQKITAPFKADGKDFSVRSPEDAIRLMQQGVNYSRRMQELKPMKQLNRMLTDHGLNDPNKLNFLIDLSKGDKGAIEKLLKDHKIDTVDLDTEKETGYQGNNYAGNSQDNEFRDAIETTMQSAEGQQLVSEVHKSWDPASKARLREDPSIMGNLVEMKQSGVYEKVVAELDYQKSIGYLTDVPFLQAFDMVGESMAKAGVFGTQEQPAANKTGMAPLASAPDTQPAPVASGARKAPAGKKAKPNPHLSSTPPSKQSNPQEDEIDYDNLSDEEFAKLAPPT